MKKADVKNKKVVKLAKETKKPVKIAAKTKIAKKATKSSKVITKDMFLGEVMVLKPGAGDVFLGFGLHCFGCPMSAMESLEEAAQLHEIDLDLMLKKLNEL